ncbi:hypothetical protein [Undibacterium sp. TJN19]|uniref:hypothetical protein n=1 Tax=Undibacterium sp. TJN19 TaxID=3413055 RepID=UPI003BF1931C
MSFGKAVTVSALNMAALAMLAALGGCQSQMAPLSFLNGNPERPLPNHEYPVRIVAVDHAAYPRGPVQVAPGQHTVLLQLARSTSRIPSQKLMTLDVAACTRYYIVAKKDSIMEANWEPMILDRESVGGCKPEEEIKKAAASSVVSS